MQKILTAIVFIAIFVEITIMLASMTRQTAKENSPEPTQITVWTKPTLPKVVRHQLFQGATDADEFVGKCIRDGFIIKTVAIYVDGSSYSNYYIIAEKY